MQAAVGIHCVRRVTELTMRDKIRNIVTRSYAKIESAFKFIRKK